MLSCEIPPMSFTLSIANGFATAWPPLKVKLLQQHYQPVISLCSSSRFIFHMPHTISQRHTISNLTAISQSRAKFLLAHVSWADGRLNVRYQSSYMFRNTTIKVTGKEVPLYTHHEDELEVTDTLRSPNRSFFSLAGTRAVPGPHLQPHDYSSHCGTAFTGSYHYKLFTDIKGKSLTTIHFFSPRVLHVVLISTLICSSNQHSCEGAGWMRSAE
jgi:hypothetical protein